MKMLATGIFSTLPAFTLVPILDATNSLPVIYYTDRQIYGNPCNN